MAVDPSEVSNLTTAQQKALSLLPIPSAVLSILGSSTILYLVVKRQNKDTRQSYHRILFGMSACDILFSISMALNPFLEPSTPTNTSPAVWAIGNQKTCSLLGFLNLLSLSAFWYNGMLSFYYLATIRFGLSPEVFAKRYEGLVHTLSLSYPLVTATIGLIMGVYDTNEIGPGCWINNYPKNCGSDPTETGENCTSEYIAWVFGGIPLLVFLASIAVNNLAIYLYVRRTIRKSRLSSSFRQTEGQPYDAQTRRVQAVATQAFLYVASFSSTMLWIVVLRAIEGGGYNGADEASLFPLLMMQSALSPLTGFFNLLVYLRPRYLQSRQQFPTESRLWAIRRALWGNQVLPSSSSSAAAAAARANDSDPERRPSSAGLPKTDNQPDVDRSGQFLIPAK